MAILRSGGLVAFPTETVYGLGADARNPEAVARIFSVKGRPQDHPVIVHIAGIEYLQQWGRDVPALAWTLARAFWPGPLTLIVHRAPGVPDAVTGGQDTVGLRVPSHPVAQALLRAYAGKRAADRFDPAGNRSGHAGNHPDAAGIHPDAALHRHGVTEHHLDVTAHRLVGVAAPSANRFGRISPTTAAHVRSDLGGDADMILDGGACAVGIESTIVDCSRGAPVLLRPGRISAAQIAQATGVALGPVDFAAPRSPGALASHYAPRHPLRVVASAHWDWALAQTHARRAVLSPREQPARDSSVQWIRMSDDAVRASHDLYADLRLLDACDCELILVEAPPPGPEWDAIGDRLSRAATEK